MAKPWPIGQGSARGCLTRRRFYGPSRALFYAFSSVTASIMMVEKVADMVKTGQNAADAVIYQSKEAVALVEYAQTAIIYAAYHIKAHLVLVQNSRRSIGCFGHHNVPPPHRNVKPRPSACGHQHVPPIDRHARSSLAGRLHFPRVQRVPISAVPNSIAQGHLRRD